MKSLRTGELRSQDSAELKRQIAENQARLTSLSFQKVTGHLENSAQIVTLRRDIARLKTVLRERETTTNA
jgi:large subunit ribosomal protein L29